MNPEIKAKWLEALRSGDYQKGIYALQSVNHNGGAVYCCLGVLVDVVFPEEWTGDREILNKNVHGYSGENYLTGTLSPYLLAKAEMSKKEMDHCVAMNDRDFLNFRQIADWVEGNL